MRVTSLIHKVPTPTFSYNVTREYPYKWFTPVAIVGGILLIALFSAINFFSTAYIMVSTTTNFPKEVEGGRWSGPFGNLFMSKTQPECRDAVFPVGSSFFTNHGLFSWQPTAIWQHETWYNRPASQVNVSDWGIKVMAEVYCTFANSDARTTMVTYYDPLAASEIDQEGWLGSAKSDYWSLSLLLAFYEEALIVLSEQTIQNSVYGDQGSRYNLSGGYIHFRSFWAFQNITDEKLFSNISWAFFDYAKADKLVGSVDDGLKNLKQNATWPNIWPPIDRLARAMYGAVSIDLGLNNMTTGRRTLVYDDDTLEYWTANFSDIANRSAQGIKDFNKNSYIKLTPFEPNVSSIERDESPPAVIDTSYSCQERRLKSHLNIFISILVADLVLLRAAWSLYNLIVGYYLKDRHPESNVCDDCLARKGEDEARATAPVLPEITKMDNSDEHTIELDEFGPASPPAQQDDQQSLQSLLTHRRV
ncbi:hypothetical protein D6D10_10036 [Aureobasidium pullulans]|uniref:Uncharacterized protein n=1 Tax=Aureobasidium pullulans TaxID=5580 RepID=A0A4S9DWH5_AURPU|nr:hypothetical protein D6D10_10036 [Aureobasidium pullulans]